MINALARLQAVGWITWEKTRRRGRQTSNRYQIQQAEMLGARSALGRVQEVHTKGELLKGILCRKKERLLSM